MSRTDKTRPHWVKEFTKDHAVREVHQHEKGPCTLPGWTREAFRNPNYRGCYFTWTYTGVQVCGCPMCTAQAQRKAENRKVRHGKRAAIAAELDLAVRPDACECPCHSGPDHCAVCTNDYADLCAHEESL